jgi:hypothetical protein
MKMPSFYLLQMMQHEQTVLHVSQLRFSLVKPWFVALLRLSGCTPDRRLGKYLASATRKK